MEPGSVYIARDDMAGSICEPIEPWCLNSAIVSIGSIFEKWVLNSAIEPVVFLFSLKEVKLNMYTVHHHVSYRIHLSCTRCID